MLRRLLPLLLSVPLAVALVAPADAAWWSSPDASGNVDGIEYPVSAGEEECVEETEIDGAHRRDVDITRLAVRHGRRDVVVTVHFDDLDPRHETVVNVPLLTPRSDYTAYVVFQRNGEVFRDWVPGLQSAIEEQVAADPDTCVVTLVSVDDDPCRGLRVTRSLRLDQVRLRVPRGCLDDPRAVRVAAEAAGSGSWREGATVLRSFHDRWAPDGRAQDGWFATYGPWVRAAR